jgi:7,8-dihydro-6-hydroxymethylpterin-pyrophosphokinase
VTLPHPEIANRLFVLKPLAEIAPKLLHPVTNRTSEELLQDFVAEISKTGQDEEVYKTSWTETGTEVSE